jgi:hypothetical protein
MAFTADAAKAKTNFLQGVQQSIEYYWNIKDYKFLSIRLATTVIMAIVH